MRNHTTPAEDNTLDLCEDFGGAASDAVGIVDRLDDLIDERDKTIAELEAEIAELEKGDTQS